MKKLLSRLFLHATLNGSAKNKSIDSPFISDLDFENTNKITKNKLMTVIDNIKQYNWIALTDIKIQQNGKAMHYLSVESIPNFKSYQYVKIDVMLYFQKKKQYFFMQASCIFLNFAQESLKESMKEEIKNEDYIKTLKRLISIRKQNNQDISSLQSFFRRVAQDYSVVSQLENFIIVNKQNLFPASFCENVEKTIGFPYDEKSYNNLALFIKDRIATKIKHYLENHSSIFKEI